MHEARAALDAAQWIDGKVTAGYQAQTVKENLQLPEGHPVAVKLGEMVLAALARSPLFMSAALPLRVFPPMFNRYTGGGHFGTHVDTAIRAMASTGQRIRTDISATLFFSTPDEYDGGELLVEDTYGVHQRQAACGPHGALSRHQPASRHAGHPRRARRILLLDSEHDPPATATAPCSTISTPPSSSSPRTCPAIPPACKLTGVYHNLLRRWAEM